MFHIDFKPNYKNKRVQYFFEIHLLISANYSSFSEKYWTVGAEALRNFPVMTYRGRRKIKSGLELSVYRKGQLWEELGTLKVL